MSIIIIIYLLFSHWVADFIFQDEKWAITKKDSLKSLISHTVMYSLVMGFMMFYFLPLEGVFLFVAMTFVGHTVVDYFTSKWVGGLFAAKKNGSAIPNFGAFSAIGLDQFIHYVILILTLYYVYGQ